MKKPTNFELSEKKYTEEELEIWESEFDGDDWFFICTHQTLSESFIEKFKNKVNWDKVYQSQIVSIPFILNHWDKVYESQCYSTQFTSTMYFKKQLQNNCILSIQKNKKITEEEKQEIINTLKLVEKMTC